MHPRPMAGLLVLAAAAFAAAFACGCGGAAPRSATWLLK